MTVFTGHGITINAASDDQILIKNITINGLGGLRGIDVVAAGSVEIEDCSIRRMTGYGGRFAPTTGGFIRMKNCTVADSGSTGIYISATGGDSDATLHKVNIVSNMGDGINLSGSALKATIRDSHIGYNTASGMNITTVANTVAVENCLIESNVRGIWGGGINAAARISSSHIVHNTTGLQSFGGDDLRSFGNNRVAGNGAGENFTSTVALK